LRKLFYILATVIIALSCSTEKNTTVSRFYHNLTAKYNTYFNANEAFKQGNKKINTSHKDDYSRLLPVFPFTVKQSASAANSDMERTKEKTSKVIKKHSITAKPKRGNKTLTPKQREFYNRTEYCDWIDRSYNLMGKALFYQHDFYGAETSFEFVIKEYTYSPARYEASIWIARTYTQLKKYNDAITLLQIIDSDVDFPKKLRKDHATTYADVLINQKRYKDAIPWLEKAIKWSRNKKDKARYNYILAQIYQMHDNYMMAAKTFEKVIKLNPPYEMAFNAQINRAASSGQGANTAQVKRSLYKMLRDEKNIDYKDQIYYALAKIAQNENNETDAIKYYSLSASNSINNSHQKALAYLELANIYYERQNYLPSKNYLDSCLTFLNNSFPDYNDIYLKSKNLTDLAVHLTTVIVEDSLQKLALLPERDRNRIIDKIIEDIKVEEEKQRLEQQQQQLNSMMFQQNQHSRTGAQQQSGKWYFYNPAAVSFGMAEFRRKWGNRTLEDNWRRQNKAVIMLANEDEELDEEEKAKKPKHLDNKNREYYLQHLPLTDSLMKVSHKRIEKALFSSGEIYMNRFRNYNHSINSFEELNRRYPNTEYQLVSYYDLYRLNIFLNNNDRAEYYKNLIINNYPNSNYAHMLSNPNYLKELQEKQEEINELYEQAYISFRRNRFSRVFTNFNKADSLLENNPVMPKFTLLKALSYGGTGRLDNMKEELRIVIEKYPGTDEKLKAETILALVETGDYSYLANIQYREDSSELTTSTSGKLTSPIETEDDFDDDLFKVNDNDAHLFTIIYPYKQIGIEQLKYNLFNFNTEHFIMFDFEYQNRRIDDTYAALIIKSFEGKREATRYYRSANRHKDIITRRLDDKLINFFSITESNLEEIIKNKEFDIYKKFFERNYLRKK